MQILGAKLSQCTNILSVVWQISQISIQKYCIEVLLIWEITTFEALSHEKHPLSADWSGHNADQLCQLWKLWVLCSVFGQLFSEIFVEMLIGQKGQEECDSEIKGENIGNFIQDGLSKGGYLFLLAIQNT